MGTALSLVRATAAAANKVVRAGKRLRAIAAALLSLGDYVESTVKGLLSANKVPGGVRRVRVRLPGIQRHCGTASGEFR